MLTGVHLDNVESPPESSYRRIRLMRADVASTLWTAGTRHRRSVYEALAAVGVHRLCIRVGDERIAGSVTDYLTDVDQAVNEAILAGFTEDEIDVQILNEPNLGPGSAVVVGSFVGSVLRRWRRTARPLLPPVSRGKEGWRDYARAMVGSVGALPKNAAYAVHAYREDAENLLPVDPNGVPVVVTEFSHPDLAGRARGLWVVERLRDLSAKGYGYACQFIVDGVAGGAWPEGYRMTDAEAIEIGERGALPEPTKEPTPMPNPWAGRVLTVWNLPVEPQAVIDGARSFGCDGVEIKVSDGASPWGRRRRVSTDYVAALRAGGLRVMGWSYNYCDGLVDAGDRGDGVPEQEAVAALTAINALRLDGWTADLEIECEGHPDFVATLLDSVRAGTQTPIAAHVWGTLGGHEGYPAQEIVDRVDCLRPMIYRPVWSVRAFLNDRRWGEVLAAWEKPVCPVWGITDAGATAAAIAEDRAAHTWVGEAIWEFSGLPGQPGVRDLFAGSSVEPPKSPPDDLTVLRDETWALAERWGQAGSTWTEAGIKALVALGKEGAVK